MTLVNRAQPSLNDFVRQFLAEGDVARRAEMVAGFGAGLELVQALKDEVDRLKNADGGLALLAGERALEVSAWVDDPAARPLGLWACALGLTVQGRFLEALPHFQEARQLYEALGRPVDGVRAVMRQVQALAMTGNSAGALELAVEIRDTFKAAKLVREAAQIEISIGGIYTRLGRPAEAEAALMRALTGLSTVGDRQGVAQTHINLGNTYRQQDRFEEAREQLELALGLFEGLELTEAVAGTTVDLAQLYRHEGRLGEALRLISRARVLYEQLGHSADAVLAQLEEARVHLDLNLLGEAETLAAELVEAFTERDMRFERAEALVVLGLARSRAGNPEALADLQEARQSWRDLSNPAQAALSQLYLASLYLHTAEAHATTAVGGELPEETLSALNRARQLAESAVAELRSAGARSDLALGLVTLVQAQLGSGDLAAARPNLLEAEQLATGLELPPLVIECKRLLGRLALEQGDLQSAETYFADAAARLEDVRASLQIDEFKSAYVDDKLAVYGELVTLLLAQNRAAEAFAYAERAKARTLLDLLAKSTVAAPTALDPAATRLAQALQRARDALDRLYLAAEQSEGQSWHDVLGAERRVTELTRELERLTSTAETLAPVTIPSAAAVCAGLTDETVLLEYFSSGETLTAFVLTRGGVRAHTLGALSEVRAELGRLSFFMNRAAQGAAYLNVYGDSGLQTRIDKALGVLYDLLIRPLNLERAARDLVIVPHGPLHTVPFAALCGGEHYLIDDYALSFAPSAAVYTHCVGVAQQPEGTLLAMGVPTDAIPAVREEVATIAALAGRAETAVGDAATLEAFFTHAPAANVVHLATHGVYRPDNPAFSGLRLHDGWLTARDLYTVKLRASLVVLSACESALSSQGSSDEQFGLARGFLHAGAPTLVASLWPVKDEQTYQLIRAFYARLYSGESVRAALRSAQLEVRAAHPNPYYWAAFSVIGDPNRTVVG